MMKIATTRAATVKAAKIEVAKVKAAMMKTAKIEAAEGETANMESNVEVNPLRRKNKMREKEDQTKDALLPSHDRLTTYLLKLNGKLTAKKEQLTFDLIEMKNR